MSQDYTEIYFDVDAAEHTEILMALLSEYPSFSGFEERDGGFCAYILERDYNQDIQEVINTLQADFKFEWRSTVMPEQNWNTSWESQYEPVCVEKFCIVRAEFHPAQPDVQYELLITPKMSFGTGHHATTYMMLYGMQYLDFQDKSVLDYGTGTGVLAILASKLGAKNIDAIDIDEWSYLNAQENSENNHINNINFYLGDVTKLPPATYDIILANINRNVIVGSMETLAQRLHAGGNLLVSGFYKQNDAEIVVQEAQKYGLSFVQEGIRDYWCAILFKK